MLGFSVEKDRIIGMGYKKTAAKGVSWITFLRILTRGMTFVKFAILGRLLTPLEFGYFGIASLVLSFLEILTETGINIFLVQQKGEIREYVNSAWVVSIIRGAVISLVIVISAPIVTAFFSAPDAYSLILLISLVPLIRGFINPAIITFQKELMFGKEFQIRTLLFFIDTVVTIALALITKSASSFVFGLIASAFIEVLLSYLLIKPWPKLVFEANKVKHIISRGWWVTITGIFSYFADNGDNIAVGRILGSSPLGIYQMAYKFSTLPISEITNVVNQVIFPVYSKFSDDKKRLSNAFLKVTILSSIVSLLLGLLIFLFADVIVNIVLGDQWTAAIPAIRILSIYGILRTIFGNFAPLFLSVHRQDYVAKMTFFRTLALAVLIIPLVNMYGMVGAGVAMLISIIIEVPVILFFARKVFR